MEELLKNLSKLAQNYPKLKLLILFGSQAKGLQHPNSDWDFGYLAESDFDYLSLYSQLTLTLETDKVDLVDLKRASGLLRYRAVSDAYVIYECQKGVFEKFWFEVVDFWCENSSLFRKEYETILKGLNHGN